MYIANSVQWRCNEFEVGGGGAPPRPAPKRRKFCCCAPPPFFGSKSTISGFGERFRDGQYSLVSILFVVFLLTLPAVPSHL